MSFDPFIPMTELAAAMRRKQLSPVEVLRTYLARIERFNGELNAIVTLHAERAMDEARTLEQRIAGGADPGPLAGLPFAVKDLEDVAGMRTTYGSPMFTDNVAPRDSLQVERLRAAGAYPIGKTNTPEFGAYMQTSNAVFGATRHPWNLERTPGGSIMPTLPLEAFPIGMVHPTEITGRPIRIHDAFPFTHPFNLSGHPALSLPAGMTDSGLPAAIQFVAPRFREDLLLRLGRQFEQARPWPLTPQRYRN